MFDEVRLPEAIEDAQGQDPNRLNRKITALERLLDVSRQVSTLDYRSVLKQIMKNIIEMTCARRGMLMLCEDNGDLRFEFSVNLEQEEVDSENFDISRSIAQKAVESGQVLVVKNVPATAGNTEEPASFIMLGLKAVMAIPLKSRDRVVGVIYIDTDTKDHTIYDNDLSIFNGFGSQAAIAIENAKLHRNLQQDYFLLKKSVAAGASFDKIVYQSRAMHQVCESIKQVLSNDITVIVQGETGTGKELVARAVHYNGLRKDKRFLSQNAGALPDDILESELFGHRRGAFSGAVENKTGLFEVADGGTVFLDEIGEASHALQVRLLRLLETGTFRRVGDTTTRKTNVRIVAATNRDLQKEVAAGRFREDLYYRLSVFPIFLPPLRERREDIPLLVNHFIEEFNRDLARHVVSVPKKVMDNLQGREWKGNIRELRNVVQRLMVLTPSNATVMAEEGLNEPSMGIRTPPHVAPQQPASPAPAAPVSSTPVQDAANGQSPPLKTLEQVEREHIRHVLDHTGGNQVQAAKLLGLNRSTLRWRIKKLGV